MNNLYNIRINCIFCNISLKSVLFNNDKSIYVCLQICSLENNDMIMI